MRYRVCADPSVPGSHDLVVAVTATFENERKPVETIFKTATGFTQSRRIAIVKALSAGPMRFASLRMRTHIPTPSLVRHMQKLRSRNIVVCEHGTYALARPRDRLAAVLIKQVLR